MTFGKGAHTCLGANLARLEIRIMFETLLPRLASIEQAGDIVRVRSNFVNGIKRFPVRVVPTGSRRTMQTQTSLREHEGDLVVQAVELAADEVVAVTLADPGGEALPPWTPGAHVDLILEPGLVRQYSLCGSPSDSRTIRVAILKAPDGRGGSAFVHERVRLGSVLRVRGPRNHFPLVSSPRYLFIAGGIGITPLLPMMAEASAAGADWTLLYGGRSRSSMAFIDELARYAGRVILVPQDELGILDLDAALGEPRDDTLVYCCGPEGLLTAVEQRCASWPARALHMERFAAKPAEADASADRAFELVLARSGLTLTVPSSRSVFDVVQQAGVSILGSCHEGICGTCEQIVLDGDVDHRDSILDAGRACPQRDDDDLRIPLPFWPAYARPVMKGAAPMTAIRPGRNRPAVAPTDCWYVLAPSETVGRTLRADRVAGVSLVVFRTVAGQVVAFHDRCVHRPYPLSAGHLDGDELSCGLCGFVYGPDGQCVRVPTQSRVPVGAAVQAYPVREEQGLVWVWPGEPGRAWLHRLPDLPWLIQDGWSTVGGEQTVNAGFLLLHESFADVTKIPVLVPEVSPSVLQAAPPPLDVEVTETTVSLSPPVPAGAASGLAGASARPARGRGARAPPGGALLVPGGLG